MEMDKTCWQQERIYKDKKLFVQRISRINTTQEMKDFTTDYGVDNFNATLRTLDGEDYKKVIGRFASINMPGK